MQWRNSFAPFIVATSFQLGLAQLMDSNFPGMPTDNSPCEPIGSWNDFRKRVERGGTIILCPFQITKTLSEKPLLIEVLVHIVCKALRKCIITGEGSHIYVKGGDTESLILGIIFKKASDSAIRYWGSQNRTPHKVCECDFIR